MGPAFYLLRALSSNRRVKFDRETAVLISLILVGRPANRMGGQLLLETIALCHNDSRFKISLVDELTELKGNRCR
jgi:hypothetical protein